MTEVAEIEEFLVRYGDRIRFSRTGCWEWTGATSNGYGRAEGICAMHRYLYGLLRGPVDPALDLDHLCRNRKCVRPSHLDPVTRQENLHRGEGATMKAYLCPRGPAARKESFKGGLMSGIAGRFEGDSAQSLNLQMLSDDALRWTVMETATKRDWNTWAEARRVWRERLEARLEPASVRAQIGLEGEPVTVGTAIGALPPMKGPCGLCGAISDCEECAKWM